MGRKFALCKFLLCGLALLVFVFVAGCGIFGEDDKVSDTPAQVQEPQDPLEQVDIKITELKRSRHGVKFDKTQLYYEMRLGAGGGTLEQLGKRFMAPGLLDFGFGDPSQSAGTLPVLAFVCGNEAALPNPKTFVDEAAAKSIVEYGLTEEEIAKLKPSDYAVSISLRLGSELKQVALTNPLRASAVFVVVEMPQGLGTTSSQKTCEFPRGDYRALELLDTVYFMNGPKAPFHVQDGYAGSVPMSVNESDLIDGVFAVMPFSGEVIPGTLVLGLMDGQPKILGIVLQQDPESGVTFVMSINNIFPKP